ncbi:MAG: hypothetical protein LBV63_04240 [Candidatus Methanoplasma sp.]|jgi:hypothetical protein|nr:hypothetical protein [Candidatus Methanoplasma sp.]
MLGFPIRLAVTFLILSLAVPTMIYMVDDLNNESGISSAASEAEKVSAAVSRAYYSGVGGSSTVSIAVGHEYRMVIGGEGSDAYSIAIFNEDMEKERLYLQRPSVRIMNNEPLEVSGERTLLCRCVVSDGTYGVEVTVID